MNLLKHYKILFCFLSLMPNFLLKANVVRTLEDLEKISPNSMCRIESDIDLKGKIIECPTGLLLEFHDGHLLNGIISGSIKNEFLRPEWFGAVGNGKNDDTTSMENAIESSIRTRTQLLLKGQYKITRPITVSNSYEDSKNSNLPPSLNIIGCSNSQMTADFRNNFENIPDAAIIAYNLKDGEAALNFLGDAVVACQANTLKNFSIFCDRHTCEELSFCLRIGNSDNFYAEKIDFQGYNNVVIRCGESDSIEATGFIFARGLFQNCRFQTWPYLKNDSNGLNNSSVLYSGKSRFGFCLINDYFLNYSNAFSSSTFDSIKFLCCQFNGACYLRGNAFFDTCMWSLPGIYKPRLLTDKRFRFLPFVDASISIFITRGNLIFDNCHFEDCSKSIYIYNEKANDSYQRLMLTVRNCTIVPWFNYKYKYNNRFLVPEYFLFADNVANSSSNYMINVKNNQLLHSNDRTSFNKFIINKGCRWMFIEHNLGVNSSMIDDEFGSCVIKELVD